MANFKKVRHITNPIENVRLLIPVADLSDNILRDDWELVRRYRNERDISINMYWEYCSAIHFLNMWFSKNIVAFDHKFCDCGIDSDGKNYGDEWDEDFGYDYRNNEHDEQFLSQRLFAAR